MSKNQPDLTALNKATENFVTEVKKVADQNTSGSTHSSTSNSYSHSTHDSVTIHNGVVVHEEHTVNTTGDVPNNG